MKGKRSSAAAEPDAVGLRVTRRYARSVDIARDLTDPAALDGYIVTPAVREALGRVLSGLVRGSTQRAFRIVGPYGAGKSALGLLLAKLADECGDGAGDATALARARGIDVPEALPHYVPLVLTGRRGALPDALLDAVAKAAAAGGGRKMKAVAASATALADARTGGARDNGAVLDLLDAYARAVRDGRSGVLVVIDEMGRFLEHMSLNRATEDPSFVQQLAERAGGARDVPVAVVALLHHRFADYAAGLGRWAEAEWARSAERFEEVAFQSSAEQSLYLLGQALEPSPTLTGAQAMEAKAFYREAGARGLFLSDAAELAAISRRLHPLHPAAAAALIASSRRFGQHERSLYGFLLSLEPHGLQRFVLGHGQATMPWYRVSDLFDHLAAQERTSSGGSGQEGRWDLAVRATVRGRDLAPNDLRVLKCVAMLAVLDPLPGLVPDAGTVAWCAGLDESDVEASLGRLCEARHLYRRPHRADYSLWSGTSVDLAAWLDDARSRIPAPARMPAGSAAPLRPLVAHRHYHRTGTLRTFQVLAWDGRGAAPARDPEADGAVLVVPVHPDETIEAERERLAGTADTNGAAGPLTLVCLRQVSADDLRAAHELALWSWIGDECRELRTDGLARGEVTERIEDARSRVEAALRPLGDTQEPERREAWLIDGGPAGIGSRGQLSAVLSRLCDDAFRDAPVIRNELVNRGRLSSAAASARMRLLELMAEAAGEPGLGLVGAPPEKAIYLSVLAASGLHRELAPGVHGFAPPDADPANWTPAWRFVEDALASGEPRSMPDLLAELARPPFGMRAGPALILLAAVMIHGRSDVALLERNTFQPEVTGAHFMRMAKNPGHFALRSLGRREGRSSALRILSRDLLAQAAAPRPTASVKSVVEALYRSFNALPVYAMETQRLTRVAQQVRLALRKGREPIGLLFSELPAACGLHPDGTDDAWASALAERLNEALTEMADALPALRAEALGIVLDAFGARSADSLRSLIEADYGPYRVRISDHRMRAFVDRGSNAEHDETRWLDGLAGLLVGRRLDAWRDGNLDEFGFELRAMAKRLARWLANLRISFAEGPSVLTLHIAAPDGTERTVVVRPGRMSAAAERRLDGLRAALGEGPEADEALAQLVAERMPVEEPANGR